MDKDTTLKNEQKKSEKNKNGVVGGIVFGILFTAVSYLVYLKIYEFPIGKIIVYILAFLAVICFAAAISSLFDYKESKN